MSFVPNTVPSGPVYQTLQFDCLILVSTHILRMLYFSIAGFEIAIDLKTTILK